MSEPKLNPELEQKLREALSAPAPDPAFANHLRAALIDKAADMQPAKKAMRLAWRLAFVLLVLSLLGYFFGPTIVTAMRQLFGYVPGAGLVDQSVPLRILAEPVSVTRDGVTLTVESAVLSLDKSVLTYTLKNVPWEALSHREDIPGCMSMPGLRVPGGEQLAVVDGGSTLSRYQFTYPSIAAGVYAAQLELPCIQNTLPGKAPENWSVGLRFIPAPAGFQVAPVVDVPTAAAAPTLPEATGAPSAVPSPFTLVKVVDLPDGYIFAGTFHAVELPKGADSLWPTDLYSVKDANAREIAYSELQNQVLPVPSDPSVYNWGVEIKGKQFAFPLSITMKGAMASNASARATFDFETGANPQKGQVFKPNLAVTFAGRQVTVDTIQFTGDGYVFDLSTDADVSGIGVEISGVAANGGDGGNDGQGHINTSLIYDGKPPVGKISIMLTGIGFLVRDQWSVQWQPQNAQPGTPSPYGIALLLDKYIPLDDGYYLIGHTTWSDKRIGHVGLGDWTTRAYDAAGKEIPLEPASAGDAGLTTSLPEQFVYRIYGKAINGPLTLRASQVTLIFASPASLELDLKQIGFTGADDQLGNAWKVGMQPLDIPGLTVKVQSLLYQRDHGLKGFAVYLDADPSITSLPLELSPLPEGAQKGGGGSARDADGRLVSSFYTDGSLTGQFSLIARSANISGDWQVSWTPPQNDPAAVPDSPTPACLDLAGWKQIASQSPPMPAIPGRLAVYGRITADGQPPSPDNYGVLLTDLAGSAKKALGKGVNPSLAADGLTLAYNWSDGIHVVDLASGTDVTLPGLNADDFGPKLAPDGSQLVFVRPADMNLYLVGRDGSKLRRLTDTPGVEEYAQGWLADGSAVVYLKSEAGKLSLAAKNIASGQETILFEFPASVGGLALSPDGGSLAYSAPVRGRMAGGLYLAALGGASKPRLLVQLDGWAVDAPVWSLDGRFLLVTITDTDAAAPGPVSALISVGTCQVFPQHGFEGTAQVWVK